jgi:hypothetical protein
MNQRDSLLAALDGLFAGSRESVLTVQDFLRGLESRSYAFMIAALDLPNCIPTGIPLLSTFTGIPMLLLAIQGYLGRSAPTLPNFVGAHALPRGKLQDFLVHARPHIERLERAVHPRRKWWVRGTALRLLEGACSILIVVLALPIPFDNLLPAWAILFFCLALMESDGLMAMLGWLATLATVIWTALLIILGPYLVIQLIERFF